MSDDHLERIEHLLKAYRADGDEEIVASPIAYHWLTVGDLRAAIAELKKLRTAASEIQTVNARLTEHTRQLRHAYRAGWDQRGADIAAAMNRHGFHKAEAAAKAYVDRVRAEAVEQQPERGAEEPQCTSHAHSDFVGDQKIRCELVEGHFWHRNKERTWTP